MKQQSTIEGGLDAKSPVRVVAGRHFATYGHLRTKTLRRPSTIESISFNLQICFRTDGGSLEARLLAIGRYELARLKLSTRFSDVPPVVETEATS